MCVCVCISLTLCLIVYIISFAVDCLLQKIKAHAVVRSSALVQSVTSTPVYPQPMW